MIYSDCAYLLKTSATVKPAGVCGPPVPRSALAGELEQPRREACPGLGRAGDDEDRVVAGDGAEHFLELLLIDRFGDRLRAATDRAQDDELADAVDAGEELRQEIAQQR